MLYFRKNKPFRMQTKLLLIISVLFVGLTNYSFAQKKIRFHEINSPHFMMGDEAKSPKANFDKLVITFDEHTNLDAISNELNAKYPKLRNEEVFDEYHAIIFDNQQASNKGDLKRLFKSFQNIPGVSSATPYYSVDGGELYYFDLVNFKAKTNADKEAINQALKKHNLTCLEKYESDYPGGISFARIPKGQSIFKLSRKLNATGLFEYIYPMSNRIVSEDYTPNDTEYINQWHLNQDNDADIDAPEAWGLTTGNSNLVICVQELDGFDLTHPDLAPNVVEPYNAFLDVNDAQYLDVAHTHGTRVMGCTSAVTDNNSGVAGVAFNVKVMPIILTAATSNSVNSVTLQRAADHIIANGNVVAVTNSWSGSGADAGEDDQFQRMRTLAHGGLGSVILGSTGNYSNMQIRYPACYKNVVGVGRTTQADFRYSSSNWHDSVDVSAPGSSILTTDIVGAGGATGDYTTASGTSFSTPITAGVVGLMASINPNLTGEELKDFLEQSCEKVGNYPYHPVVGRPNGIWHNELGYGRINALTAVLLSNDTSPSNDWCANAIPLNQVSSNQYCYQNASLNGATQSADPLNCSGNISELGQDVWFEFTALNSSMEVNVNPLGTGLDVVVAVYDSCGGSLINCVDAEYTDGSAESLTLGGLTANQTYYIRVYHSSEEGQGPSSFEFDICLINALAGGCITPAGLGSSSIASDEAVLDWDNNASASSYEIAVRPVGQALWTSYLSSSNSVLADELYCNTTFDWKVRTICSNGGISPWSTIANFSSLDCQDCYVPFNVRVSSVSPTSATLRWESSPPLCVIDGFDGELFEGTGSNGTSVVSWQDLAANTYNVTGLQPNTTYTYIVRHDCDCGVLGRSNYVYHTFTTPSNTRIDLEPIEQISNLSVSGSTIDVTASHSNTGISDAGSFQLAYYLSESPFFSTYDYLIATESIPSLNAGVSRSELLDIDFCNQSIPDGTYYLGFYTDNNQEVSEYNEVNNFLFWPDKPITIACTAPSQYVLTLTAAGSTAATVNGAGTYPSGSIANIGAIPNAGWEFIDWTENGVEYSDSASTSVIMDSDRNLVANFAAITSIRDQKETIEFSFSPNPNQGNFTLNIGHELKGAKCEMYNLNGQLVASYLLDKLENEIAFDGAVGVYFLQLVHPEYEMKQEILIKQ